jgi:hypothetical protein
MEDDLKPRVVKATLLIGGAFLFGLLAVSAVSVGVYTVEYLVNAFNVIAQYGAEDGIKLIFQQILSNVIVDYGDGFARGALNADNLRSTMALISGIAATCLALVIYPVLWLRFARISLAWLQEGFWVFTKVDSDREPLGALPEPAVVQRMLEDQKISYDEVNRADKRVLGTNAKYIPVVFQDFAKQNAYPILSLASSAVRVAFWTALTGACLLGLFAFLGNDARIPLPAVPEIAREILSHYAVKAGFWVSVFVVSAVIFAWLDVRFARSLVPKVSPATKRTLPDPIKKLTVIKPPTQFASVFKTELEVNLGDIKYDYWGLDSTRETFADHSSFVLNFIVEGESRPKKSYAHQAAKKRLVIAASSIVAGAVVLLFGLLPDSVVSVLNGDQFGLLDALVSPLYLVTVLTVGNLFVRKGRTAFSQAEDVLRTVWFETPVVIARLDGTVNTDSTSTGKAASDSTGAELRFQQSKFDARMIAASLECFAKDETGARSIWAFSPDRRSDTLLGQVSELLRKEGSESLLQAASQTITDTETVRDATELRRAELQLQLEKARRELEMLEAPPNTGDG